MKASLVILLSISNWWKVEWTAPSWESNYRFVTWLTADSCPHHYTIFVVFFLFVFFYWFSFYILLQIQFRLPVNSCDSACKTRVSRMYICIIYVYNINSTVLSIGDDILNITEINIDFLKTLLCLKKILIRLSEKNIMITLKLRKYFDLVFHFILFYLFF